jgi:hypothetical protein
MRTRLHETAVRAAAAKHGRAARAVLVNQDLRGDRALWRGAHRQGAGRP